MPLTTAEAAALLGLSERQVQHLAANDQIPGAAKFGTAWQFPRKTPGAPAEARPACQEQRLMLRPKPDNALVTWDCCANRWELILTRLHPERDLFTPLCEDCGNTLLPASLQYMLQLRERLGDKLLWARRGVRELASEFALLRPALKTTNERDREAETREGLG